MVTSSLSTTDQTVLDKTLQTTTNRRKISWNACRAVVIIDANLAVDYRTLVALKIKESISRDTTQAEIIHLLIAGIR